LPPRLRYTYEVINGRLIHVFPQNTKDDPENLLNVRVKSLNISDVEYDAFVRYLPLQIPELQNESLRRSRAGGVIGKILASVGVRKIHLHLKDVTVREILNEAARYTERYSGQEFSPTGWIYTLPSK
jgi:hypothetical protein